MADMFTATASIKKAVALMNDLESVKFPLLLSRITQKLHLKDEQAFTETEEDKLLKAFNISQQDLTLVIHTCELFLHQAAYHGARPNVLGEQLRQIGLEEEKVLAIVETWKNGGRSIIEQLRQRSLAPKQLEDIKWRLNLQMAQSTQSKMKTPNAQFEFSTRDDSTQKKEKIRVDFTHDELYSFYSQLETIQGQIDSLS